jgi:N-acetylmuramoyl-L-alanine amidase
LKTLIFIGFFIFTNVYAQETHCLAEAIYHEARGESKLGQQAVALVTLNRTKHSRYPKSICAVVYQKGQYSWTRKYHQIKDTRTYNRIHNLATKFLNDFQQGKIPVALNKIKHSLYFNNGSIRGVKRTGRIGNHNFFR